MTPSVDDLALLALARAPDFSWAKTRGAIEEVGSPTAVLQLQFDGQLLGDGFDAAIDAARAWVDQCNALGIGVASLWGEEYPRQLHSVHDAPPVLYWSGHHNTRDGDSVAIVGTRRPDEWGTAFARELATLLAHGGVPVVSGLARGIDGEAMRASLAAGGRTIGVIGTGHGVYYPPEHRALQDEVAEHLLISQFEPGSNASKRTFPMRNVVMSGFSSVTVIVQAGETSGTRIQAHAAVKHGRPVVLTTRVVAVAAWAQDLVAGGYDVEVVSSPREAVAAVEEIHHRRGVALGGWEFGALFAG